MITETELDNKYFMYKSSGRSLYSAELLCSFPLLCSLFLVSLLAWRRAVAGVSLVLIGLGRLELRRGPGLEVSRVLGALRSRRGPVVLLELQGVLRVELCLLLQPAVILLLVLSVLRRIQWRLGGSSTTSILLRGTSRTSIATP